MKKDESPRRARRRERLAELISEVGSASKLATETGTPKSHISAMQSGARGLGDVLAEKLERHYGKNPGWFDMTGAAITAPMGFITASGGPSQITTPRGEEQSNVSELPRRAKVPLISLIQAGKMSDVEDLFHPGMATHWVEPRYTTPSEASYALMVEGDSMESPLPGALTFPEGTIVIVDPNGAAGPNSYVIAKDVFTQKATFKKLTTDGVRWFLKPLNPAYATVEIDDPAMRVIGKVVEHQPPGGKL